MRSVAVAVALVRALWHRRLLLAAALPLSGLAACAKPLKMPDRAVDQRLTAYIAAFEADAARLGHPVSGNARDRLRVVSLVDDIAGMQRQYNQAPSHPGDLAGVCTSAHLDSTIGAGGAQHVTSSRDWQEVWISADMLEGRKPVPAIILKELIYHELGHCFLGLDHAPESPHSIMSPVLSDDPQWLEAHWDQLARALFLGTQTPAT
jgi:hypothetical protein